MGIFLLHYILKPLKIKYLRYDTGKRNIFKAGYFSGSFAFMTIITTGTNHIYNRKFNKMQTNIPRINWRNSKFNPNNCNPNQLHILTEFLLLEIDR